MTFKNNKISVKSRNLRIAYILAVAITIMLGLASRKFASFLPLFIAENAGDVLWAMMVYFGFRLMLVRKSLSLAVALSFLFSFGIEFSQLYQEEWINRIRGTLLGALILGHGFLAVDLLRYSVGILLAMFLDKLLFIARNLEK